MNLFAGYCGGSRALSWLITANVAISLAIWIAMLILRLCGQTAAMVYDITSHLISLSSDIQALALHPWAILSYMFIHFSPMHLLFNMLWLYCFGRMLADTGRDSTILILYISSGILGGVLYIITSIISGYTPEAFLTGASASVLAIVCATAIYTPDRTINLLLLGEVRLKWVAIACVALTILSTANSGAPTIAAHISGIIFGIAWAGAKNLIPRHYDISLSSIGSNKRMPRKLNIRATVKAMNENLPEESRLDELLDKMRLSGYDSLSAKEKSELNYISSRLK